MLIVALVAAACSGGGEPASDESSGESPVGGPEVTDENPPPLTVESLVDLLPAATRGAFSLELGSVLAGDDGAAVAAVLDGDVSGPYFSHVFAEIGRLTAAIDRALVDQVLFAQGPAPSNDRFVIASTSVSALAEIADLDVFSEATPHEASGWEIHVDGQGTLVAFVPGGWLVLGPDVMVRSVLDIANGDADPAEGAVVAALQEIDDADLTFAYALTAGDGSGGDDRSLRSATIMSGTFDVASGTLGGALNIHAANAADFVDDYNRLNRHAIGAEVSPEAPLTTAEAGTRVVVSVPAMPLAPTADEATTARNLFKKLFVGMDAHDYAEGVVDGGAPWFDLIVKSEADGDEPPSPASVFFRWEFKDEAAIEAFEKNELPEGFTIAPTRFFESDDPEGQYFFLLNIYNAGGGSIVGGARAEWDVYVNSPVGGPDPNPGERPRFFVVDALAETVSFDPVNLVTPAEPLSHDVIDGVVTSTVGRLDDGEVVPVWESTFPQVDPATSEVTRFTREMAIGNDYIYWGGGAADRLLYNATTYNHDAYLVDPDDVAFVDSTRWSEYLKPEILDVVYYVNTLEYIASPLANLDSDQLDVAPEWREELIGFKGNGHQEGLMRKRVEQLFRGIGDAMVGYHVSNETPSAFYHFEITDPAALAASLDLPTGHSLAPITIFDGDAPGHFLTLSVFEIDGAGEGVRAEWSTTTDTGDGRPKQLLLELMTADVAIDPVDVLHLPDSVTHEQSEGGVATRLQSPTVSFEASITTGSGDVRALSTDWVEAGDLVCRMNGVCDAIYYDAETLDVPVGIPTTVTIDELVTPWDGVIQADPAAVFYRTNAQEYAAKRWLNLDVEVEELPFGGLADATHTISGSGSLVGRDTEVVNSNYVYRGDAVLDGDQLTFAIDQEVDSELGIGNIFTTGSFDLTTGTGSQTVVDCLGAALLCSDIIPGTTSIYTADALDSSDPNAITWRVDLTLVLTGSFGTADSESSFEAVVAG